MPLAASQELYQLTPVWGAEKSYGAYDKVVRWTGLGLSVVGEISRLQFSGDETFLLIELSSRKGAGHAY